MAKLLLVEDDSLFVRLYQDRLTQEGFDVKIARDGLDGMIMVMNTLFRNTRNGFTLIELLIVIAVIAILAGVVFVALDPLSRFQDARDTTRVSDLNAYLSAIKVDQVDNGGSYLSSVAGLTAGEVYMIVNGGTMVTGCDDNNISCDTNVSDDANCVDLSGLVTEGYMGSVKASPTGTTNWDDGSGASDEGTGYTLSRSSTGILTVRSCESENTTEISVAR